MTSNTLYCCVKFIIHKKLLKICNPSERLVVNFVKASFYQNDVLFDYSIKMPGFIHNTNNS
jgi:hypothetical protein